MPAPRKSRDAIISQYHNDCRFLRMHGIIPPAKNKGLTWEEHRRSISEYADEVAEDLIELEEREDEQWLAYLAHPDTGIDPSVPDRVANSVSSSLRRRGVLA